MPRSRRRQQTPSSLWQPSLLAVPLGLLNLAIAVLALALIARAGWEGIGNLPSIVIGVSFSLMGMLVASRRARNPIGWIFLLIGLSQSFVVFAYETAQAAYGPNPPAWSTPLAPAMSILGEVAWLPGLSLMITYGLLLFPDGRLPSRRWRPVAWLSALPLAMATVFTVQAWPRRGEQPFSVTGVEPMGPIGSLLEASLFPLLLLCGALSVVSIMLRFRRSRGVERQQLEWVAFAAALTVCAFILMELLPGLMGVVPDLVLTAIMPSIPLAAGIAILRHRLFDIDLIIRRTLTWALLTGVLAILYLGGILVSQGFLRALTGSESQLAVVVTTLAIAALFTPLRRRFQGFIDRAFHRRKYDAARILQRFGASARSEVELARLTGSLAGTIDEALRPGHVSVWLRPPGSD